MYLSDVSKDKYFKITEIWFYYKEREEYKIVGIFEGKIIHVIDNINGNVLVNSDNNYINFDKEKADLICGEPVKVKKFPY